MCLSSSVSVLLPLTTYLILFQTLNLNTTWSSATAIKTSAGLRTLEFWELEKKKKKRFKDFLPGVAIVKNVTGAIY